MPHGFFTVEEWRAPKAGAKSQWVPVLHLDAGQSLTKAIAALENRGKPGLFRVIQTQRQIWAEMEGGKLPRETPACRVTRGPRTFGGRLRTRRRPLAG